MILQRVDALTRPPPVLSKGTSRLQRLIDQERTPGCCGELLVDTLSPGTVLSSPDRAGTESVVYLLSGAARWDATSLRPGDGVFSPPGSPPIVSAGPADAAVLLVVLAGCQEPPLGTREPASSQRVARRIVSTPASESQALGTTGGFVSMGVTWLATRNSVGATGVVLATSTFSPGGSHQLHRHAHADEYFLVVEGGGLHLQSGCRTRLAPGDLAYIPAGEWHGFVTDPGTVTRAVYGYLGAGSLDEAGYELESRG